MDEPRAALRQALVSYRGNRYSVPPELPGAQVTVSRRLDDAFIDKMPGDSIVADMGCCLRYLRWPARVGLLAIPVLTPDRDGTGSGHIPRIGGRMCRESAKWVSRIGEIILANWRTRDTLLR